MTMKNWLAWAGGVLALIAVSWGGFTEVDTRYAHSGDTKQRFNSMEKQFLRQDLRQIERDIFALQQEASRRKLSTFELERLQQLTHEKAQIEKQLQ